jgi:hypothetical protein
MLWGGLQPIWWRFLYDVVSIGVYLFVPWIAIDNGVSRMVHLGLISGSFCFTILR